MMLMMMVPVMQLAHREPYPPLTLCRGRWIDESYIQTARHDTQPSNPQPGPDSHDPHSPSPHASGRAEV